MRWRRLRAPVPAATPLQVQLMAPSEHRLRRWIFGTLHRCMCACNRMCSCKMKRVARNSTCFQVLVKLGSRPLMGPFVLAGFPRSFTPMRAVVHAPRHVVNISRGRFINFVFEMQKLLNPIWSIFKPSKKYSRFSDRLLKKIRNKIVQRN